MYTPRMFCFNHCLWKQSEVLNSGVRHLHDGPSQAAGQFGMGMAFVSHLSHFHDLKFLTHHLCIRKG